jgi:cation:H+ antiporter
MAGTATVAVDLAFIASGVVALWLGARWFVRSAVALARRFGVSELVIGLTVVAIGTSAPEFAVTVDAALRGASDIAVGNVVGSNVFNLGFVLGAVAVLGGISATDDLLRRDSPVLVGTAVAVLGAVRDLHLARWEGGLLVGALLAYLVYLFRAGEPLEAIDEADPRSPDASEWLTTEERAADRRRLAATVGRLVVGLALLVGGARLLVVSASDLARLAGLPEWVIGVTVVAAGTSTPELVTSLVAARRGRAGVSAGNLLGSDLFNMLGVLGVAALIEPLTVSASAVGSMRWVLALVVLAVGLLWTGRRVSRVEGVVLLVFALVRWVLDVVAGG